MTKPPPQAMTSRSVLWRRSGPDVADQEQLLRRFGSMASSEDMIDVTLHECCLFAAEGVAACWARLLRYCPDREGLVMQAGIGRHAFRPRHASHAGHRESAAASAWENDRPERSQSRICERRYEATGGWTDFTTFRTMCVPVAGDDDVPFGVIEVGSQDPSAFLDQDVAFLLALSAHVAKRLQQPAGPAPIVRAGWFSGRAGPIPPMAAF